MKQQKFFSPDTESGSEGSKPVKRLSERYGIPEKDVEALLYGSRAPKSEALGSDTKGKIMADEFRPMYQVPPPEKQGGWSPVNVLSAIVGILGVMALTIILIAVINRHGYHHPPDMPPPMMMSPGQPHPMIPDSCRGSSLNAPQEEIPAPATQNEAASGPSARPRRSSGSSSSGFSTPNSIEAQEHLAEMRAEGNTKARIRQSKRNGMTIYTVK